MAKTSAKEARIDALAQRIVDDNICPQLAESATQLVMGQGSLSADIMFIGEAPGKEEDKQGLPFVGRAGQLLNEMLAGIGLERQDVYITNIVKYRPPNNRDPLPEEISAFMPYLAEQVKLIKPKLIATLGRFSTNVFLPQIRISEAHGQPKRRGQQVFLPLYHPAVALYNGGMRQTLIDDFAKIPAVLELINKSTKSKSDRKVK